MGSKKGACGKIVLTHGSDCKRFPIRGIFPQFPRDTGFSLNLARREQSFGRILPLQAISGTIPVLQHLVLAIAASREVFLALENMPLFGQLLSTMEQSMMLRKHGLRNVQSQCRRDERSLSENNRVISKVY